MTPQELNRMQRDMVIRSLLLAPTRTERSEERPRKKPPAAVFVAPVDGIPTARRFVLPVVVESRPL